MAATTSKTTFTKILIDPDHKEFAQKILPQITDAAATLKTQIGDKASGQNHIEIDLVLPSVQFIAQNDEGTFEHFVERAQEQADFLFTKWGGVLAGIELMGGYAGSNEALQSPLVEAIFDFRIAINQAIKLLDVVVVTE